MTTENQLASKARSESRSFAQYSYIVAGLFACIILGATAIFSLLKHLHDTNAFPSLIVRHIEELYKSQTSNPLAQFLYWNKEIIAEAIRSTNEKAVFISLIVFTTLVTLLVASFALKAAMVISEKNKTKTDNKVNNSRKTKGTITSATSFALGFFLGSTIISMLLLIPLLILPDRKLGSVLSFVFDFYSFKKNPMAEILKGIIKETFKNEVLFNESVTKAYYSLLTTFLTSLVLTFLSITILGYFVLQERRNASPQPTELEQTNLENIEISSAPGLLSELYTPI